MERSWGDFAETLKEMEGFDGSPYTDVNQQAIGYGHKILPGEDFSGGLSKEQASQLLFTDLQKSMGYARSAYEKLRPGEDFESLSAATKQKLTERAFNMGPDFARDYPKWTNAVLNGDTDTELAEHHRSFKNEQGEMERDTRRNGIYEGFFHPDSGRDPATREATQSGGESSASSEVGGDVGGAGAPPPPTKMDELLGSGRFANLGLDEQAAELAAADPEFAEFLQNDPDRARRWMTGEVNAREPGMMESAEGGLWLGVGSAQMMVANMAMIAEELGWENDFDESWRAKAELNFIEGNEKIGSDWEDWVVAVLAGLPGGIAVPAIATAGAAYMLPTGVAAAAAPMIGFGLAGALGAAHEGPRQAAKRGLIDAALGAIYPATAHLGRMSRVGIEYAAAYAVNEQEDPIRRMIESGAMAGIAGTPKRRAPFEVMQKLGVKDKFAEQAAAVDEALRTLEANQQSTKAADFPLNQKHAAANLKTAVDDYVAGVKANGHPTDFYPHELTPGQRDAIRGKGVDSMNEQGPIAQNKLPDGQKPVFQPGSHYQEQRLFNPDESSAASAFGKKFQKAGEVLAPLLKAFGIPSHHGIGQGKRLSGPWGWYDPTGSREMHHQNRTDVQTVSHEFGHDISFENKMLHRWHAGPQYKADVARIDEIYFRQNEADIRAGNLPPLEGHLTHLGKSVNVIGQTPVGKILRMWKDGELPKDLHYIPEQLSISYNRQMAYEGMAESFRAYLTNNKAFRKDGKGVDFSGGEQKHRTDSTHLPEMGRILEQWKKSLPRHQRRAIEKFQKEAHAHLEMSALDAMTTRFGKDNDIAAILSDRLAQGRMNMADDLAGFWNLEMKLYGHVLPDGAYEAFRRLRGVGEMGERMLTDGYPVITTESAGSGGRSRIPRFKVDFEGDGIAKIFGKHGIKSKKQLQRVLQYMTARQAAELKKQVRLNGLVHKLEDLPFSKRRRVEIENETREQLFSQEMIDAGLKLGEQNPKFKEVHKELRHFAERVADVGEVAGIWNRKQRDQWNRHEFIFSFFREMENSKGVSKRTIRSNAPIKTLHGSSRQLRDPFMNLMQTHGRTIQLSMENIAKRKLLAMVQEAQGGGRFGELLKPIPKRKDFKITDIEAAYYTEMKKAYPSMTNGDIKKIVGESFDPATLEKMTLFMGNEAPYGPDVMTVFVDGKPKYYKVTDPLLMNSLENMRRPQLTGVLKHWNSLRRLKQRFITLTPGFIAANFARDVAMASIMSKTGHFHLGKSIKGFVSAIREDKHFKEFIANGGGASGINESAGSMKGKAVRIAQRTGFNPKRLILDGIAVHRMLDKISRATELAARLGEYKAARKQGKSAAHAAFMGREVSTDFGMRGEGKEMNFLATTVPFLNAMVQGGDRLYRGLATDGSHRAAVGTKIAAVAGTGMALYAINRRNEQYMDLPDWDKWGYWHFYVPRWDEETGERLRVPDGERFAGQLDYHHFKMPKLWEVGSISTVAERMLQSMFDDEDFEVAELASDVAHLLAQNFGMNLFDRAFPLPLPVVADIAVEQFSNRVLFTGNPIESQARANQEQWMRTRPGQAKVFGEAAALMRDVPAPDIIKSPARAEALLRGIFGEFTHMGATLADSLLYPGGPSARFDRMPVVSRFYEGRGKYSRQEREFYERFTEMEQAESTMREMASNPNEIDRLEEWLEDPRKIKLMGLRDAFSRQRANVTDINNQIEMIQNGSIEYTPEVGEAEIDRLTGLKRDIMEAMNRVAIEMESLDD